MALTAMHDRYLITTTNTKQTAIESFHCARAAALFNQKLSMALEPPDRDALWATAILLAAIGFFSIDTTTLEETWPLRRSSCCDLEWLKMEDGVVAMWKATSPYRPGSAFHCLASDHDKDYLSETSTKPGVDGFPNHFVDLCDMDHLSDSDNNPYHRAVSNLTPLLEIECNSATMLRFFSFTGTMHPNFKKLLEHKDPRALLLLAYWYALVCQSHWWIARRATLECRAICIYLETYYTSDDLIQRLLPFPKSRCDVLTEK